MNAGMLGAAGQQPVGDDELRDAASIARSTRTATRATSSFGHRLSRRRRQRATRSPAGRGLRPFPVCCSRSGRARRQRVPLESDAASRDAAASYAPSIAGCRSSSQRTRVDDQPAREQCAQPAVAKWQRARIPSDGWTDRALGGPVGARPSRLRRHDGAHRRGDARARSACSARTPGSSASDRC